jgi:hypothetical protein
MQIGTAAGQLIARYQAEGIVHLTVGFDLPEESADPDDLRGDFALPNKWTVRADEVKDQQVRSLKQLIREG